MRVIGWDRLREKLGGDEAPCRRTIEEMIKRGEFVRPVQLAPRRVGFIESEVDAWIEKQRQQQTQTMAPDKQPIEFGIRGMAAALQMTDKQFRDAYKQGEVAAPDTVRQREPRWSPLAMAEELKKRFPSELDGLQRTIQAMEALIRAERAEGWHDE